MIWNDMKYDIIWYDMMWYSYIVYDMIWYNIWYTCNMVWYIIYDMIQYDMIYGIYTIWYMVWYMIRYICWLQLGLSPGGSSTVHIYTQTIQRTTQITIEKHKQQLIWKNNIIHIFRHFPYNVIFLMYFYYILLYFTLFIAELHIQPHLPTFYHNYSKLYSVVSYLTIHNFS